MRRTTTYTCGIRQICTASLAHPVEACRLEADQPGRVRLRGSGNALRAEKVGDGTAPERSLQPSREEHAIVEGCRNHVDVARRLCRRCRRWRGRSVRLV